MQNLFLVGLILVIVSLFIGKGHCLKCYQCRSDTHHGCSDTMNISWSQECIPKDKSIQPYCRKISQKLKFKDEKGFTSIRECAYEKHTERDCYLFKWLAIAHQEVCECADENCNRGSSQVPEFFTVGLVVFVCILNYLKSNSKKKRPAEKYLTIK